VLVVHQQVVLLQKTGEQHAVPMLVGHFGDQLVQALLAVGLFTVT